MNKPKILLSGNKKLQFYVDAINGVGGIAEAGYLPKIDNNYDGLILCGGNDIDPRYYNEDIDGSVNIDYERDKVEFKLLKAFVDAGKPILGICRGCQIINVFFGGSLFQDFKNSREHSSFADFDLIHSVNATEGSIARELYGKEFVVNSFHHQAIKELGDGLRVTMMSTDNSVVEGIEHKTLPIFAVQWHPERMCFSNRRTDTVDGAKIFEYFIRLCTTK